MQLIPNALRVLLPKARRSNQFFRLPTDGIAFDVAQIAEVAHEAATDGEDELLYVGAQMPEPLMQCVCRMRIPKRLAEQCVEN